MKTSPAGTNMTVSDLRDWTDTSAWGEYRRYRDGQRYDGYTRNVVRRTMKVVRGEASQRSVEKVRQYLARHREQSAGERRFGDGRSAVSAHTAGLRNWGYDPAGRFA
jgi:hypothetical protein